MSEDSVFDVARKVADAVLLEGYVLYPYRASAQKNQVRWQFGVLAPRDAGSSEPWFAQTECLVEPDEHPMLAVTLRFLQVQARSGAGPEDVSWDEGVLREVHAVARLTPDEQREQRIPVRVDGGEDMEGTTLRRRWPLHGLVRVLTQRVEGPYGVLKVRVRVENQTAGPPAGDAAPREEMLRRSLVATHTLLAVRGGTFVSLLDPPEWAGAAVSSCDNQHTWPVLVGEGRRDVMLSSPIILYDYPEIAPESPADLCDATEIDELLMLRTMALTDEEKVEARATDERSAAIVDRADHMPPELMERLHGAVRYLREATGEATDRPADEPAQQPPNPRAHSPNPPWWDPGQDSSVSPETDSAPVPGGRAAKGTRVRLRPGGSVPSGTGSPRRTDAQDMFVEGRTATVQAVFFDIDGGCYLAVTLDDDPAAEMHGWYGRYLYFTLDEVEIAAGEAG
ncbi:MAG: hypothetical protein GEV03_14050 [Streptosporangiales bacterium]|nr:hypothetical protein [Streptosporangiales bacterium]